MSKPVSIIGIEPDELRYIRILVSLLRHPRPGMAELARQALRYLAQSAGEHTPLDPAVGEEEHRPW